MTYVCIYSDLIGNTYTYLNLWNFNEFYSQIIVDVQMVILHKVIKCYVLKLIYSFCVLFLIIKRELNGAGVSQV